MLTMLVLLTAVAGALFELQLAAWWVVIPPSIMLLGYLMLLREAARADAELARRDSFRESRRARREASTVVSEPVSTTPAGPDSGTDEHEIHWGSPDAEIIDISARVSDQLYDQYADAKLRAVGD
jgi:hypothetical protein